MERKVCIVTGANAGIGKAASRQLAREGFHVVMACRNEERGRAALEEIISEDTGLSLELMIVDMGRLESVREMAARFGARYERLDVLILNAAVFNVTQKRAERTPEGVETIWATNHLGPVLMTMLLLDKLKQSGGGRILTVSSKGLLAKPFLKVNLDDPEFKSGRFNVANAYYQSKLAQMMFTRWIAEKLKGTGVTANAIRVTAVKVDVNRHPELSPFMKWVYKQKANQSIEPAEMAQTYVYLAKDKELEGVTGKYFDEKNRRVNPGKYVSDMNAVREVMELTGSYLPELGGL